MLITVTMLIVVLLLYLSVSMCAVIGQFCWPYFSVWPAKFESFLSARLINLRDINKVLLTSLQSYRSSFFPVDLWPTRFALGP